MVTLMYMGDAIQKQYWTTKQRYSYTFSARRNQFLVDAGDAEEFLAHRQINGKPMFKVIKDEDGSKVAESVSVPAEPTPTYAEKPATISQTEWNASRAAQRDLALFKIDPKEITGTGMNGRVLKSDVDAFTESWNDQIEERATEAAVLAAQANGVDIRFLFNRVPTDRRIGKKDVDGFIEEYKETLASYEGDDSDD